jgi:hypothetical protein
MKSRCRSILAAVSLALTSCGKSPPSDQPASDVALTLVPYFRDLRTAHVVLGDDTLNLLVDTGGGATLLSPEVARRMGCRPYGREVGYRMTGERIDFQQCDSAMLSLAGWHRRLAPVGVYDVNALLPKELPRLDGVLALDAFRGQVVTLNWRESRLTIHAAATSSAALHSHGLDVRPATGESGGMLTVFASIQGRRGPLWLLLDSGNLRGLLVDAHVFGDTALLLEPDSLLRLQFGDRDTIRMRAHTERLILDGVLGTDFLQRRTVALDLRPYTR